MTQSGDLDGTFIYSYDGQGIVEVRDGSNVVVNQLYRGAEYIDEIVSMRFEEGYAVILQDANFNVVGAVDMAGQFLERVFYEPYGLPVFEGETRFGDYDGDHSVDSGDDADLGNGQTCWGANPAGDCRVFDFNFDLTLDASDETVLTALTSLSSNEHRVYGRTTSPLGLRFLHQGLEHDPEISSYQNRARQYLPVNQRFAQRDPLGYIDWLNLYLIYRNNPSLYLDSLGTDSRPDCCRFGSNGECLWPPLQPSPCDNVTFGKGVPAKTVCDGNGGWTICWNRQAGSHDIPIDVLPPNGANCNDTTPTPNN